MSRLQRDYNVQSMRNVGEHCEIGWFCLIIMHTPYHKYHNTDVTHNKVWGSRTPVLQSWSLLMRFSRLRPLKNGFEMSTVPVGRSSEASRFRLLPTVEREVFQKGYIYPDETMEGLPKGWRRFFIDCHINLDSAAFEHKFLFAPYKNFDIMHLS